MSKGSISKISKRAPKSIPPELIESVGKVVMNEMLRNAVNYENLIVSAPVFLKFYFAKQRLITKRENFKASEENWEGKEEAIMKMEELLLKYEKYLNEKRQKKELRRLQSAKH